MGIFRSLFLVLTTNLDLDNISLKGHVGGGGVFVGKGVFTFDINSYRVPSRTRNILIV